MRPILAILFISLIFVGCKRKGCTDPNAQNYDPKADEDDGTCLYPDVVYNSNFTITPAINGSSILYDSIMYPHPLGYNFSVITLTFFISDVVLYKQNGDSVELNGAHYYDCKMGPYARNFWNQKIDDGEYTGIAFDFGLNENYNITGYFLNPPENLMEWPVPMGGGYHYMKFEGKYDSVGVIKSFNIHTGGLAGVPYHFRVALNQNFTINDGDVDIHLHMNLENWLQQPNDFDFNVYGPAIMGNAAAQTVIMQNGYNVFSVESIN